ncbi:MAG: hypothetical protein LQ346_003969 [Caloplaca aetnensis]|nr:MAG: hypothetical protein LQ346_003969 [Caloplaca aetnensis]
MPNGHLSPPLSHNQPSFISTSGSESELSDAEDTTNTILPSIDHGNEQGGEGAFEESPSDSSHDEDAVGSDDADYYVELTLPFAPPPARHTRSSSLESSTFGKRKAGVQEDDFMHDPELWGLRRSGRARPSRRIVESDSEESASDINTAPRKRRKITPSSQGSKPNTPSDASPSDSGSEHSSPRRSRPRTDVPKKRHRRLVPSAAARPPVHVDVRFAPTRQAAKVSNYNEDDDDMFDDEEDMQYQWVDAPDGNIPQVDCILRHRLRTDTSKEASDLDKQDFDYYVKWQGKAHFHATWEPYGSLVECRGHRKAENYFKKVILEDLKLDRDEEMSLEEKETRLLRRETDADAVDDYTKVERVIAMWEDPNSDGNILYQIKWKRLPYESCTWEEGTLVSRIAPVEIEKFRYRENNPPISGKPELAAGQFKEQPEYIKNGTLRDFQRTGVSFMALNWKKSRSVILADEMGLGKTVQTVSFLNWLRHDRLQQGPFLVIVPLSTMASWAETFDYWTPDINYVIYNGNDVSRSCIRDCEVREIKRPHCHVLLTTYEYALKDAPYLSQIRWQFMAVDEAHRLKNRSAQLYERLLDFKTPHRLLITGTPVQNDLSELAALLHFLNPGDVEADMNIDFLKPEEASQKVQELTKILEPIMIRRTKKTVEKDLPPKTEKIIRVELSDIQLEYYKNILTRNYAALNEGAKGGAKQSLLNLVIELKKVSNHPFLIVNAEDRIVGDNTGQQDTFKALVTSSGKLMLLDGLLKKLKQDGHRVLVFSQMVRMLDILQDYMKYRGYQFQRLDGTVPSVQRTQAMEHFNKPDSPDFCFLLSTRAGGLGINLMTADTVILFDSDWNPQADLQAMARAHRIGQTKPVSVFRLVSKETIEEEVLERARNKLMLEYITIQKGVTDKHKKEQLELQMSKAGRGADAPTSSEDISLILKRRGQKMFEQSGNQKRLEELDIDSVLENAEEHKTEQEEGIPGDGGDDFLKNFEYTDVKLDLEWDQIIPKEALAEIKAEEERKAHEKFLDDQIRQNAPRKRKNDSSERDERAAKKRARDISAHEPADDSDVHETKDPRRPLIEREVRNLIRAYLRYGSIDDERGDDLVKEARLVHRDRELLRSTLKDLWEKATKLKNEDEIKIKELEMKAGKQVPMKEKKSVTFEYMGTQRNNAYTISERAEQMRLLRNAVRQFLDEKTFRIPEAQKGAETYTCEWGAREDGMLCVGIVRHGYGAWPQIRDDPDLGLGDKIFLEEQRVEKKELRKKGGDQTTKTPQAVHLVRRMHYLLSVLQDKMSNNQNPAARRAVENHHRNNKKNGLHVRANSRTVASASPAPSAGPKRHREAEKHRIRHNDDRRISNGEANGQLDRPRSANHRGTNGIQHESGSASASAAGDTAYRKLLLKPIQSNLSTLKSATKDKRPDKKDRAQVLRSELQLVGDFVMELLTDLEGHPKLQLERGLWDYVSQYWPNPGTPIDNIRSMYRRLKGLDKEVEEARVDVEKGRLETDAAKTTGGVNGTRIKSE